MNQFTRRDFLRLCGTSCIGLTLAACGVIPTPVSTDVLLPSATPTATLLPTATPTFTRTEPPTSTGTPTALPSLSSTSTPTQIPKRVFNNVVFATSETANFMGYPRSGNRVDGTTYQTIPDPTNSGRGLVLKGVIEGDPLNNGTYWAYRAHSGTNFNIAGEASFAEDVLVGSQLLNEATSGGRWFTHHNVFDNSDYQTFWHIAIRTGIRENTNGYMILYFLGGYEPEIPTYPVAGAPKFTPDQWHRMVTEIRKEQIGQGTTIWVVYLFQDDKLVTYGTLPASPIRRDASGQPTWLGYHGGLYAGSGRSFEAAKFTKGGFALFTNTVISH